MSPSTIGQTGAARGLAFGLRLRASYDLLLLAALATLAAVLQPLALPALRIPLGLGLALFGPGYAAQALLFPRRGDLDGVGRAGLSFVLSVAQLPLLILALDKTPWGFQPWLIARSLAAWVMLLCAVAVAVRAACAPAGGAAGPGAGAAWRALGRGAQLSLLGGALACAALFGAGGAALLAQRYAPPPSAFYILGPEGLAQGYPRAAVAGAPLSLTAGVASNERAARRYSIEVWAADPWGTGRRERVLATPLGALEPGEGRELPLSWAMPWAGPNQRVELLLVAEGSAAPLRRLELWLDVSAAPTP